MKLSIVLPTYNRFEEAIKVIDRVITFVKDEIELIVVDNSEEPKVAEFSELYAKYNWIKFLKSNPKSLSGARNLGISESCGDWVAFLDDDCLPGNSYFSSIFEAINSKSDNHFFIGRVLPLWNNLPSKIILESRSALEYLSVFDPMKKEGLNQIEWGPSSAMCVPRQALEKIGGFEESLGRQGYSILISNEETDMQRKLLQEGFNLYFLPEFTVHHNMISARQNFNWLSKRAFLQGASDALLLETSTDQGLHEALDSWDIRYDPNQDISLSNLMREPKTSESLEDLLLIYRRLGFSITRKQESRSQRIVEKGEPYIPASSRLAASKVSAKNVIIEFVDTHPQNGILFKSLIPNSHFIQLDRRVWTHDSGALMYLGNFLRNLPNNVGKVFFSSLDALVYQRVEFEKVLRELNRFDFYSLIHKPSPEILREYVQIKDLFVESYFLGETSREFANDFGIDNAMNLGWIATSMSRLLKPKSSPSDEKCEILFLGEFREEKKYREPLRILAALKNLDPQIVSKVKIKLFGTDVADYASKLESELVSLGLEVRNHVLPKSDHFRRMIPDHEFYEALVHCDVLVSPYDRKSHISASGPTSDAIRMGKKVLVDHNSLVGIEMGRFYKSSAIFNAQDLKDYLSSSDRLEFQDLNFHRLAEEIFERWKD